MTGHGTESMSRPVTQCPQKGSREVNADCVLTARLLIHSATLDHGLVPATFRVRLLWPRISGNALTDRPGGLCPG